MFCADVTSERKWPPCTQVKVAVWKTECRARDLWPGGRLISAVTSPDVRLAVSPSQLITFAHTHSHATIRFATQLHTRPDTAPSCRPLLTVPPELLHVKLEQTDCCFLSITIFSLSIDNTINQNTHTHTGLEGMCLSIATSCVCLRVCFEDSFIVRRCS